MKRVFVRIAGLAIGLFLLVGLVPFATGVSGSRSEHLTLDIPATLDASEFSSIDLPSAAVPTVPLAESSSVLAPTPAPESTPPSSAPKNAILSEPAEASVAIPADDIRLEMRVARSKLAARPSTAIHSPPVSWDIFVHLPPDASRYQPLRVLVALHGMGGHGERFASSLIAEADRNHWVLIAPTLPYQRDYMDPVQLREEDLQFGHVLHSLIDGLQDRLGLTLRQHVLLFGFSRGAQLAHRFALFHPDHVETVAAISAGSYTLPLIRASNHAAEFPYGIANLSMYLGEPLDLTHFKQISFWVAVGEKDNRSSDVSRAFDEYSGKNRVERAHAFESALESLGMDVHLNIYPNAGHEVTTDMCSGALRFLRQDELADHWND